MNEKPEQHDTPSSNYFQIIKNNVTPLDLFIISKINEGLSLDEVAELAEKQFDIHDPKKTIKERFKRLLSEDKIEERIILNQHPQYLINPAKLYATISLVLIKANLENPERNNLDIGTQNIFDTIVHLNNTPRFGKPIKQLFTISGWMYDYVGLIYENNIERFHSFRNHLITEGIAKTVDIIPIDTERGFLFNPISSPNYQNYKQFLVHYHNRMNTMMDELKTKDIDATKTLRFFDKDDYGLKVISGKGKGDIYPIDVKELKIGRYHDNDIIIQDISVSRRHARIAKMGNQFIFKDQSTNGSYINNDHVVYKEVELHDGDNVKIGKTMFKFQKLSIEKE